MTVKIGINPLTWTNDDLPELGAETPLETCLEEGKLAGFQGFELGNKFPRDPNVLGPILQAHQLELVSGWYSLKLLQRSVDEEIEAVQSHLKLLKALGAKVMVVCEVTDAIHCDQSIPVYMRQSIIHRDYQAFFKRLDEFGQYLSSQGIALAYHHHMGTLIQTASEVDLMMTHTSEAVGLLLDTGHLTFAGDDPFITAEKWLHRINHVHCKDIRAMVLKDVLNRRLSFLDAVLQGVFTVPGDGCVDYPNIFSLLKSINYSGWLVVEAEQDPAVAHPLTYAKLGFNNLSNLAKQAALIQ